jgi:hypothetical protein
MAETDNIGKFKSEALSVLNFPNLMKPRAFKGGDPKYDANFEISDEAEIARIKAAVVAVAKAKWPNRNIGAEVKAGSFAVPWVSGDKAADKAQAKGKNREYSRGRFILIARTGAEYPPKLSVVENGEVVDYFDERRPLAAKFFYSGVNCWFVVKFEAYPAVGGHGIDGVTARLWHVLSVNRGEQLAGGSRAGAEVFSGYAGRLSDEAPTKGNVSDDEEF